MLVYQSSSRNKDTRGRCYTVSLLRSAQMLFFLFPRIHPRIYLLSGSSCELLWSSPEVSLATVDPLRAVRWRLYCVQLFNSSLCALQSGLRHPNCCPTFICIALTTYVTRGCNKTLLTSGSDRTVQPQNNLPDQFKRKSVSPRCSHSPANHSSQSV